MLTLNKSKTAFKILDKLVSHVFAPATLNKVNLT